MIKKVQKIFLKYGGIMAPVNLLKWRLSIIMNHRLAVRIARQESSVFTPVGHSKFESLYLGDVVEYKRLVSGERKVLFYSSEDSMAKEDKKYDWELNRCQQGPVIALYAESEHDLDLLFNTETLSQVFKNTNAMEVAIAAINLLTTYQLLDAGKQKKYGNQISKHLQASCSYIIGHSERGICYSANHYFFNLIGLLWICESVTGNPLTQKLKKEAYSKLGTLLRQIILEDGSLYEGSTYYHKYVTESLALFFYEFENAQANQTLKNILSKMAGFAMSNAIGGEIVGIGDNDSGRMLPLPTYFNYGSTDTSIIQKVCKRVQIAIESKPTNAFESFGIYYIKEGSWRVAIRLETGKRLYRRSIGSHCHNDQLHITAYYNNKPLFIDRGVYSYVARNECRKTALQTASHNTLQVGEEEQNVIYNDWKYTTRNAIGKLIFHDDKLFSGEYTSTGKPHYTHQRAVLLKDAQLEIVDTIKTQAEQDGEEVTIYYHLHESVTITSVTKQTVTFEFSNEYFLFETEGSDSIAIINSTYSPDYGTSIANKVIHVRKKLLGKTNNVSIKIYKTIKDQQ